MSGLISVSSFLFSLITSLLIFVLWMRIALRYFHVSTLHPMSQMVIKITAPLTTPLNTCCAYLHLSLKQYDWSCLVLIIFIEVIKYLVIGLLYLDAMLSWKLIIALTFADLIIEPCTLLFYAIIIRVIMSWVSPHWQHPIADLILLVTDPLLTPLRKRLPVLSGFDFSPLVAIVILKAITLFISASLPLHLI